MSNMERPDLDKELDSQTFRSFYYLKEELMAFCRENGLPVSGGKLEISDRIACFLDTGKVVLAPADRHVTTMPEVISPDSKIESNFRCSERHRKFFKQEIGACTDSREQDKIIKHSVMIHHGGPGNDADNQNRADSPKQAAAQLF